MASPATSAERAEPVLRLRGVGRRFGGVHAVRDVELEVRPGERRAILGPNGAGKTTLFNLISGEFPPTAGSVELFGADVTGRPEGAAGLARDGPLARRAAPARGRDGARQRPQADDARRAGRRALARRA